MQHHNWNLIDLTLIFSIFDQILTNTLFCARLEAVTQESKSAEARINKQLFFAIFDFFMKILRISFPITEILLDLVQAI